MTVSAVVDALARETGLLKTKLRHYMKKIQFFEKKYGMNSQEFLERFEKGELGDEEDYFEWWSYLRAQKVVVERLKEIEEELRKLQRLR